MILYSVGTIKQVLSHLKDDTELAEGGLMNLLAPFGDEKYLSDDALRTHKKGLEPTWANVKTVMERITGQDPSEKMTNEDMLKK